MENRWVRIEGASEGKTWLERGGRLMKTPHVPGTREVILKSANQIVKEQGFTSLTLDAVAKHAGVSKGGLLYHFPSKEALIGAMVLHLTEIYAKQIDEHYQSTADHEPGAFLRSYISLNAIEEYEKDMIFGILAAIASNPSLLEPIRKYEEHWQKRIENDGLDPIYATILRLASDALVINELLQVGQLDKEMKERVIERIIAMTYNK